MDCINKFRRAISVGCLGLVGFTGCAPAHRFTAWRDQSNTSYFENYATQIEYPDAKCIEPPSVDVSYPLTIENPSELPTWDMPLSEAISYAMKNSAVIRSIGGSVVQAPTGAATTFGPAQTESNPNSGVEAALSAFDAQLSSSLTWNKQDQPLNFGADGGFVNAFSPSQSTGAVFRGDLSKRAATGTLFSLRHNVNYNRVKLADPLNSGLRFPSSFTGIFEAEMRQPMMRGAGTTFNRIAGPNAPIGSYNGVLLARINTDVSLTDFEASVINLLNDVEFAYWELYYAYRQLETQAAARQSALQTWQRVNELQKVGARGGEADAEAQARSQYYLFESQVTDSLSGANGLYAAEQRLRYLIGMPPTDGRLIRPSEQPQQAKVIVDWQTAVADALNLRVEIRRQRWTLKRRELELVAARLNRRPQLDAVTLYRYRGLGDNLINSRDPNDSGSSVYQNIFEGDFQEWQAGIELTTPVGLRQAGAAVRFAELNLARDKAVLKEQELRIQHDLSNAARQVERSFELTQKNLNRVEADRLQIEVLKNRYERGLININFLLQAQQQLATSQAAYYRSLIDYELSLRDINREKGSLLAYNQVALSEAGWSGTAYASAADQGRHLTPRTRPATTAAPVSQGAFDPAAVGQ
jgi:outer membrane protein TolC